MVCCAYLVRCNKLAFHSSVVLRICISCRKSMEMKYVLEMRVVNHAVIVFVFSCRPNEGHNEGHRNSGPELTVRHVFF